MTGAWQVAAVAGWLVAAAAVAALVALRRRWTAELERFRAVSERDALCGVYNKGALVSLVSDLFGRRGARLRGTLLLVDIDRFKDVNDEFGHAEGDEILRAVGEALRGGFRAGDIVGRFGGDEFMVFAEGLVDPDTIGEKVAALREAAREAGPRRPPGHLQRGRARDRRARGDLRRGAAPGRRGALRGQALRARPPRDARF